MPQDHIKIERAIISVSDKSGLKELAQELRKFSVSLYSTGGTEKYLREQGFAVRSISELTHFPEILDGRVKTLHPSVHGGLLYRRDVAEHITQAKENDIVPIDLIVLNLYPFEETVARKDSTEEDIIENIDIGGPAMLRSAGKNFESVALLTSPLQYSPFINELNSLEGATTLERRRLLAKEAFESVANYDRAIANYFSNKELSQSLQLAFPKVGSLRYGENPHQQAAVYGNRIDKLYHQLWGKELSYNNYLDASASLELIAEFLDHPYPVVGIIKHTNPCGMAEGKTDLDAFERAFATDTESPFGGIIVTNTEFSGELALRINEFFSEVIIAPSFGGLALEVLKKKKDRRLITFDVELLKSEVSKGQVYRSILGGMLEQDRDAKLMANEEFRSVTDRTPTEEERRGLLFTWKVTKHVKSNAIVYAKNVSGFFTTVGIGCGQTSRVASSRIAVANAQRFGHDLAGSLVASDAFFPFADGLLEAADAGAVAVIQPGGSIRDEEVIQAAKDRNISLILTGMRHFKH
jgi:phosphoribosylaminoimidazolecarboxamide formyltransferase / IMP cyclohydrolase